MSVKARRPDFGDAFDHVEVGRLAVEIVGEGVGL